MIKGTGQRLIPRKLLEWIKGLNKGEGASLNITTLTDSKGNPRFIEGNGTIYTLEGLEATYCKWSLSGSHLMLVVAGTIAGGTSITQGNFAVFQMPTFIIDKIYPIVNTNISYLPCSVARATSIDTIQATFNLYSVKTPNAIVLQKFGTTAITNDGVFRVQFDFLVDTE